jgi:uroporphyrinogen decarboxylase
MKPLLAVLSSQKPSRRPVWFMRQAGRYLPEYRSVRDRKGGFLDLCYDPAAASEVTLQPLRRFDFDASIVFADILVIAHAMGVEVGFAAGEGPVVEKVASRQRVISLEAVRAKPQVEAVCETVKRVRAELPADVALIGFCGAPWTVASYMIEGGSSPERLEARRVAGEAPEWFRLLMDRLVNESVDYLAAQVRAGAEIVQIFDSWAGDLPWDLQRRWVHDPLQELVSRFRQVCPGVPVIVFARGSGAGHLRVARHVRPDAVSLESGVPADWARDMLAHEVAVQGNLDPVVLALGGNQLEESVNLLAKTLPMERHVFNLGHGVRPETPPEHVAAVFEMIRRLDA